MISDQCANREHTMCALVNCRCKCHVIGEPLREGSFEVDNVRTTIDGRLLSPGEREVWIAAYASHFQFRAITFSGEHAASHSAYVADLAVKGLRSLR